MAGKVAEMIILSSEQSDTTHQNDKTDEKHIAVTNNNTEIILASNKLNVEEDSKLDANNEQTIAKCICGGTLQKMLQQNCYEGNDVFCDFCSKLIKTDEMVYHCANKNTEHHQIGYDLCEECFQNKHDNNYNPTVAHLQKDIWSMSFILVENGLGLRVWFIIFIVLIYMIQLCSLIALIWGYNLELNRNVIVQYSVEECHSVLVANHTICDEVLEANISIGLNEKESRTQEYVNEKHFTSGYMQLFGWASLLSMMLLSMYSFAAITNPIVMLIIAKKFDYTKERAKA
eukprot:75157_1